MSADDDARALETMERILADGRARGHGRGTIRKRIVDVVTFGSGTVRTEFLRKHGLTGRKS